MSEDAWQADAAFTVSIDGTEIGGVYTTSAIHSAQQSQAFTIATSLSAGAHSVLVTFVNNDWLGTAATDRNLWLNSATFNGQTVATSKGLYSNGSYAFTVNSTGGTSALATTPPPGQPVVLTQSGYIAISNGTISATSGDITLGLTGTGDTVSFIGGNESVAETQGGNTITTGAGSDKISLAGSGNVVDAGTGSNSIYDTGTNNTIVLHTGGLDELYGNFPANGDVLDVSAALAGTTWNGSASTLGSYITTAPINSGTGTQILLSQTAAGAGTAIANLHLASVTTSQVLGMAKTLA
jgi:hypothetical protein